MYVYLQFVLCDVHHSQIFFRIHLLLFRHIPLITISFNQYFTIGLLVVNNDLLTSSWLIFVLALNNSATAIFENAIKCLNAPLFIYIYLLFALKLNLFHWFYA